MAFISLSGVMMPGPLMAVTLARGQRQPSAGALVSLGHGIIELPLVFLIYFGLGRFFALPLWKLGVGFLGGVILAAIGVDMVRKRGELSDPRVELPYSTLGAGLVTTAANPYFFLWWATIGANLVTRASAWGMLGLFSFFTVHWLCDLGWGLLVSALSFRAGRVWSRKAHRLVFACCGVLLVVFGAWFVWGAVAG